MTDQKTAVRWQLEFTYAQEQEPALQTADCIPKGKCVVLCGSSGCGKTTLLRCVNQLIPQFYEGTLKGFCSLFGQELSGLSLGETGRLAASVFQDPRSQFFTLNSSTELAFGMENFGFSREKMVETVGQAFEYFGLAYLQDRDVFSLSSGERQLVAILAAWTLQTELLLLDEPTANLDYGAIRQLRELLLRLKDSGRTLLLSEHRLYYLDGIADEYWLMEKGQIRKKFTAAQMRAMPLQTCRELGLRITDMEKLHNREKEILPGAGPVLCAEHIRFSYGERTVLEDLSLQAGPGEVIGLVGRNGSGKTTLGKLLCGLVKPNFGTICLNGDRCSQDDLQKSGIFIMQEAEFQFFTNSVIGELTYGREGQDLQVLEQLLRELNLWDCRNQHPFSLSGGQMQKLVLLLAYLSPKQIVVLDEPTAGLDYRSMEACAALISRMQKTKLVLIITHDLELAARSCTRCEGLEQGRISWHFDLTRDGEFERLKAFMDQPEPRPVSGKPSGREGSALDARVKLLIFLLAMFSGIGTDFGLIAGSFLAVMTGFLAERRWGMLLSGCLTMGSMAALFMLFPGAGTAFLISFFPRVAVIAWGAMLMAAKQEIPGTLAALRRLHMPERIIMVISVALRFFPVLKKDLQLMGQSMATRGFFPRLRDKLRAIPQYAEVLVVPMVFRVIRIADALAASAETRGIALKNKRESYVGLSMRRKDWAVLALSLLLFAAGLLV